MFFSLLLIYSTFLCPLLPLQQFAHLSLSPCARALTLIVLMGKGSLLGLLARGDRACPPPHPTQPAIYSSTCTHFRAHFSTLQAVLTFPFHRNQSDFRTADCWNKGKLRVGVIASKYRPIFESNIMKAAKTTLFCYVNLPLGTREGANWRLPNISRLLAACVLSTLVFSFISLLILSISRYLSVFLMSSFTC